MTIEQIEKSLEDALMNGTEADVNYWRGYRDAVNAMQKEAPNEPKGDGWIRVQDELPYPCEEVLVYYDSDDYNIDYPYTKNGVFGFEEGSMGKVTHWRPLPEPPKED